MRGPTPDPEPEEEASKIAKAKAMVNVGVKEWVEELSKTKGKEAANKEVSDAVSQDILARE
eukprot:3579536-Karenia_brevis.AAC.1